MRLDDEHLLAAYLLIGQQGVLAMADLRGQAINGVMTGEGEIHDSPAGGDCVPGTLCQLHACAIDDGEQLLEGERLLCDRDGAHEPAAPSSDILTTSEIDLTLER
jgi:hypothetical protein